MIIQIKIDMKHNHAIIKYFRSYIAVIILVLKKRKKKKKRLHILHHFPPLAYLIIYPELVGSAHVRNNGSDHWSAIIDWLWSLTLDYGHASVISVRPLPPVFLLLFSTSSYANARCYIGCFE